MAEPGDKERHIRRTFLLGASVLAIIFGVTLLAILFVGSLNQYRFLDFPLGFYLFAQGLPIFVVAAAFWFTIRQDRIDDNFERSEEL